MIERAGAMQSPWGPQTLLGPELRPGDMAPEFTALDGKFGGVSLSDTGHRVRIFSVVPSVDTGVCSQQTARFEAEAAKYGDKVGVYTVSMDTPFAQKRWCGAQDATHVQMLSDIREHSFGTAFGVFAKDLGLLSRAVFVVDAEGVVRHAEYVQNMPDYPDFDRALSVVETLL